jgi:hypothetical protein
VSKYDRLGTYLRSVGKDHIAMSFAEIERVLGFKLPKSQEYPAWWSNSTSNNVMTQVWLDAGYRTEQVDTAGRRLVFKRAKPSPAQPQTAFTSIGEVIGMSETPREYKHAQGAPQKKLRSHPLFGWMKGTFSIEPGYDLTRPALDEEDLAAMDANLDRTADMIEQGMAKKR